MLVSILDPHLCVEPNPFLCIYISHKPPALLYFVTFWKVNVVPAKHKYSLSCADSITYFSTSPLWLCVTSRRWRSHIDMSLQHQHSCIVSHVSKRCYPSEVQIWSYYAQISPNHQIVAKWHRLSIQYSLNVMILHIAISNHAVMLIQIPHPHLYATVDATYEEQHKDIVE